VSARKKRNRGKHPFSRQDQPRTDQSNNPANDGSSRPTAAVKQEPVRLGLVSLVASARLTEAAHPNGDAVSKARAVQQFGPSRLRADEFGAAQPTRPARLPAAEFGPMQPARTRILWKVLAVLFVIFVPVGFVALVGMKEPPFLAFGDWWASDRTDALASLSLQETAWRSAPANPRLAIQDARGISGEPLPIGTSLDGVARDAFVMIAGLIPGMTLSTGSAIGADTWRVPATEFANTWIGPPNNFSGAVDVTVELHLADQSIADRRQLRLEWAPIPENSVFASADPTLAMQSPRVPPVPAQAAPAPVVASAHPPMSAPPAAAAAAPPAPSAIPRTPQLDPEQIAILVERGKHLIASGDLAAARVVLRRAAESKDAAAALALGSTYDPVILRELKTFGFAPDLEMARGWYEKARELGSEEAQRRIQILARPGR
jgi:hypothetical protein